MIATAGSCFEKIRHGIFRSKTEMLCFAPVQDTVELAMYYAFSNFMQRKKSYLYSYGQMKSPFGLLMKPNGYVSKQCSAM